MAEIQAHFFNGRHPDFNCQQIVVARGKSVIQPRLDDGKNHVVFLPVQNRRAERTDEFAASGLEQIKIARVVNVVADGAFGVSDAMFVAKWIGHARSVNAHAESSTLKIHLRERILRLCCVVNQWRAVRLLVQNIEL
jgi:hypothetical protein